MMGESKKNVPKRRFKEFENAEAWEQHKLGECCYIGDIDHHMPRSVLVGIPYVMTGDFIGDNDIDFENAKSISEEDYEQLSLKIKPEKGDILFARYASVGNVRYVENSRKFLISYSCAILKPNKDADGKYLYYYLQASIAQQQIKLEINTGSQQNIGIDSLKNNIVISVPKIDEQTQIGAFFRNLDNLITLHQCKFEKMKLLKKAYLTEMFPAEGERKPKLRFAGFTDDWEQRKLDVISDVRDGTHDSPQYFSEGHPFVTSKNVKEGQINYEDIQYISDVDFEEINKRSKVDKNDILMGMIGTIGNIALVRENPDFAIKNVALIKDIKSVYYLYLYHYLQSPVALRQLDEGVDGGTQKFIALNKIRNLSIAVPESNEQHKVGDYLEHLDNLITLHQHKLEKLQNIKKAYLNEMFI